MFEPSSESTSEKPRTGYHLSTAVLLALLHGLLALVLLDPMLDTGGDSAVYLSLARSLVESGEYRDLYLPGAPPHTQYPPVFAGMLAIAMLLGIGSWARLKFLIVIVSTIAVAFTFLWARRKAPRPVAFAVTAGLAVSPVLLNASGLLLSDVPFLALTMISLWALEGHVREGDRRVWIGILAVLLAYFTRTAGLALLIAAAGSLAYQRRWRPLVALGSSWMALAALWWLRSRGRGSSGYTSFLWMADPYHPELGTIGVFDLPTRALRNLLLYGEELVPVGIAGRVSVPLVAISVALLVGALFGWTRRVRDPGITELYFPLYAGLVLLWPEPWASERFLVPLLPPLFLYAFAAVHDVVARLGRRAASTAMALAVGSLLILAAPYLAYRSVETVHCNAEYRRGNRFACLSPPWRDFLVLTERLEGRLPPGAAIMSRKPSLVYAFSGYRGTVYPFSSDPADLFRHIDANGIDYLILDRMTGLADSYLIPALRRTPDAFCVEPGLRLSSAALLRVAPRAKRQEPTRRTTTGSAKLVACDS